MTIKKPQSAQNGKLGGRPRTTASEKKPGKDGRVTVRIDPASEMVIPADIETRVLAQRLMLHFPKVATVEALFAYALRKLAETTDD